VEIPVPIFTKFEEMDDADDVVRAGVDLATDQCLDLLENGVRYFHFYTLNRDEPAIMILNNLASALG